MEANLTEEGLFYNKNEVKLRERDYQMIKIEEGTRYLLQIEIESNFSFSDGKFDIEFLTRGKGFSAENLTVTDTVRYTDAYKPNKYGLICRERLFVNDPSNFSTFKLKISKFPTGENS